MEKITLSTHVKESSCKKQIKQTQTIRQNAKRQKDIRIHENTCVKIKQSKLKQCSET